MSGRDGHAHGGLPLDLDRRRRRALRFALAANAAYLAVEVVGGVVFGSLALLADAAHMLSDVAALTIALVAQALATRPASIRHTFGLRRAEVLGAQVNGLLLVGASVWIALEAVSRLQDPETVDGIGLLFVATLGLAVNVVSAVAVGRVRGASLNLRGAWLHLLADAAGSVGAMGAGVAIVVWDADWADPAVSLVIAALVLWSAWGLLHDATQVMLEAVPRDIAVPEIERSLAAEPGVETVHHLHVWSIASETPALSAHVVLAGPRSLHDAQQAGERLKAMLERRFGIEHATLELECHACDDESPPHPVLP